MTNTSRIDIKENALLRMDNGILETLLKDHSSGKNIIWATDNYEKLGDGYSFNDEIKMPLITGKNGYIIQPRVSKDKETQLKRVRDKAEVFTPCWICNAQNNMVDEAWFGRKDVFNKETDKDWETKSRPVMFPTADGKTWKDYLNDTRLEITCGEAPYLVSRYGAINALWM
jgi:hypothetical protein